MVEVVRTLNVSAEDFFDKIAESVAYDISTETGKNVRPAQIHKGMTYTKKLSSKMGKSGNVKVTLTEYESPVVYAAKFSSKQGDNFISYRINKIEDDLIEVTYSEDFDAPTKTKRANFKIMSFFYKRGSIKKINRLLSNMEAYILDEKEKSEQQEIVEEND